MEKKTCTKCNRCKDLSRFCKRKSSPDGHDCWCKSCKSESSKAWTKTEGGIVHVIYNCQKGNSKTRGHKSPEYTFEELRDWLFSQPQWETLYKNWVESGYKKMEKPSIDRLDDTKGYDLKNIQLTIWVDNFKKGNEDQRTGKLASSSRIRMVIQITLNNKYVREYYSINEASRQTGISQSGICSACTGRRKSAGGFRWKYKF